MKSQLHLVRPGMVLRWLLSIRLKDELRRPESFSGRKVGRRVEPYAGPIADRKGRDAAP
jgi:hypothetical protein